MLLLVRSVVSFVLMENIVLLELVNVYLVRMVFSVVPGLLLVTLV